jgi:hypothetical protein
MRRILFGAFLVGLGAVLVRALGPRLREGCIRRCEETFERMPADFPPKRMLLGIEEIREQTGRILRILEERGAGP